MYIDKIATKGAYKMEKKMKKSKKFIGGVTGALFACVIATSGLLAGCGSKAPSEPLSTTTDVYAFAGATTGMMLGVAPSSSASSATTFSQMQALSAGDKAGDPTIADKIKEAISSSLDKYMNVFDSVVGGKKPVDVKEETVEAGSAFSNKLSIKVSSIDGTVNTYTMYFNETLKSDPSQEVKDSDKEERETTLVGELYINDESSPLYIEGTKEIDQADGETEVTLEARFNKDDDKNKVIFKQEHENKNGKVEEEYEFVLVINGIETSMSFSMERDAKGNIEVEYEHKIGDYTANFEIEKKDNKLVIETKDFFNTELEIVVTPKLDAENNKYYEYSIPSLNLTINGSIIK